MKKNTKEIIEALSSGPVRKYIEDHKNDDIRKIILKHKEILGIPTAQLLEQIASRRKAKDKLPLYYNTDGMIYPPPANLEQSSSELTARHKGEIICTFKDHASFTGADLTGGFGVDTFFMSKVVAKMHYVEPDPALRELAAHSHRLLGASNIEHHSTTAEEFLETSGTFDFIFIDPSRRTETKKKIYGLEDSHPDVLKLADIIFSKTHRLIIKASPLYDVQAGILKIPHVSEVHVVSVNNECREILFVSEKDSDVTPLVKALNMQGPRVETFDFTFLEEKGEPAAFGEPSLYLYEPNASILKAGAFKTVAARFNLRKFHASTHLYTGEQALDFFPGRKFKIVALVRPDATDLKEYFPDGKANVTTRNYPLTPEALKKKAGLQDGGERFLIGFSGQKKKYLAVAERF